jgi:hypothetical protein
MAYQELQIAEGSDWFWWYGPEHQSENRPEFDKLFRDHLASFYRLIGQTPPDALSRPILRLQVAEYYEPAIGAIRPVIDGEVSSYFEWMGAGLYRPDERQGAMHGRKNYLREVRYGSDMEQLFVRVDFQQSSPGSMAGMEIRCSIDTPGNGSVETEYRLQLTRDGVEVVGAEGPGGTAPETLAASYRRVLELGVPLASLGAHADKPVRLQLSLWGDGLPLDVTSSGQEGAIMRWHHSVAYFFGGAFLANALPHLCNGVSGNAFQSPFASPSGVGLSSSTVNVLWGLFNLAIGYLLVCRVGDFNLRKTSHALALGAGLLVMSLMAARAFGRFHGGL